MAKEAVLDTRAVRGHLLGGAKRGALPAAAGVADSARQLLRHADHGALARRSITGRKADMEAQSAQLFLHLSGHDLWRTVVGLALQAAAQRVDQRKPTVAAGNPPRHRGVVARQGPLGKDAGPDRVQLLAEVW